MTELAFERLSEYHDRLQRMLRLLQWLRLHLGAMGCDAQAIDAARELMPFFNEVAPTHHEIEESSVFPPLLAAGQHVQTIYRLQREHLEMADLWTQVRALLEPVAGGSWRGFAPDDEALLERFTRLYDWHIAAEDELVFPAAARVLAAAPPRPAAQDMAQRHGAG
jgi:hemerythrin-like domain-containing protein